MGPYIIFLIIVGGTLSFVYIMAKNARDNHRTLRKMRDTKTSLIRHIENGMNEISGVISSTSTTINAPVEQTSCVYIGLELFELRTSGKSSSLSSIYKYTDQGVCILEDESGTCIIDINEHGTELNLVLQNGTKFAVADDAQKERFLTLPDIPVDKFNPHKKIYYNEVILCVDDELYVIGDMQVTEVDGIRKVQMNSDVPHPQKLFVSNQSEEQTTTRLKKKVFFLYLFSFILFVLSAIITYTFVYSVILL